MAGITEYQAVVILTYAIVTATSTGVVVGIFARILKSFLQR